MSAQAMKGQGCGQDATFAKYINNSVDGRDGRVVKRCVNELSDSESSLMINILERRMLPTSSKRLPSYNRPNALAQPGASKQKRGPIRRPNHFEVDRMFAQAMKGLGCGIIPCTT